MCKEILNIENVSAGVEDKLILKNINLKVMAGEVHVIMGPNGSGKSTLANIIMNNPIYEQTSGNIYFEGENINELRTDERARKGIFMTFQTPMEVSGISVENFIRTAKIAKLGDNIPILKFHKELTEEMDTLKMDPEYAKRYLNVGFSGGEKKKNEILQMLMLEPKLAILDETDSGLDVDATKIVSAGISKYLNKDNALIIITHHQELIHHIEADYVHVLVDGQLVKTGDSSLMERIEKDGFSWIRKEVEV
ncbi:MAG: Fe-S cluster assembly ATPase SufC [Tissierellia bacterium]|nr:Fe-S cluster assembly ATPase SufC [Tissierellia bacterium]